MSCKGRVIVLTNTPCSQVEVIRDIQPAINHQHAFDEAAVRWFNAVNLHEFRDLAVSNFLVIVFHVALERALLIGIVQGVLQ
jgi:hypothetical protein